MKFKLGDKTTLASLYDSCPKQDELIWCFIGSDEFAKQKFTVIEVNPVTIYTTWAQGGSTIRDLYRRANKDQKALVKKYRQDIKNNSDIGILLVCDETMIDGFHRVTAAALERKTSALAIDIF